MQCSSTGTEAADQNNWKRVITTYRDRVRRMTAAAFPVLLGVCSSVIAAEPNNLLGIITNSTGVETGLCVHIGSNPAAFIGSPGMRLANGRAVSEWVVESRNKKAAKNCLGAWDAFSGIPLWTIEKRYWGTRRPMHTLLCNRRLLHPQPCDIRR
jgi:hypothetical protein